MRYRIARVVVTAVVVALAWPMWAQTRSERLVAGEQKTFNPAYAVGDIAIANPAVCDFRVVSGRREVMLVAVRPGFTTLTIWDQRGTKRDEVAIEIVSREFARILADMTELLRPYPDVVIKPLGDRAVLIGTVNTPDELQTVKTLANAAGNLICTVTLRRAVAPTVESPAPVSVPAPLPVPPPATHTFTADAPPQLPPPVPTVTYDPEPPAPVRRTPVTMPAPVSLGTLPPPPATTPQPVGAMPPPAAPPVAVPAAATPPPPNISPAPPSAPSVSPRPPVQPLPTPSPAPSPAADWSTPAGSDTVEYLVELYESPASAPPPEVAGPKGKRLYIGRLRSDPGVEVRQLITLAGGTSANALRGLSIGLTPSLVNNAIHTAVIVDTNLPVGKYDQKNPVWIRCALAFTGRPGQTRFISEVELARSAAPVAPPASPGTSQGNAGRVAGQVIDTGAAVAGVSIPSFGGLLGSSQSPSQPKARQTTLLIVVTPSIPKQRPQADHMTMRGLARHESTYGSWR